MSWAPEPPYIHRILTPAQLIMQYSGRNLLTPCNCLSFFSKTSNTIIEHSGWRIAMALHSTPNDGNCLATAVCQNIQLQCGKIIDAGEMMNYIVDIAIENDKNFTFEPTNPNSEILLNIITQKYDINIVIVSVDYLKPLVYLNSNPRDTIFLFHNGSHFWSIDINFVVSPFKSNLIKLNPVELRIELSLGLYINEGLCEIRT